jgi:prephenate dehydrogenase
VVVSIIGLGFMGGSLGLALRRDAANTVVGHDPDPQADAAALERGCVDRTESTLAAACADAEVVVVCAPVAALPAVIDQALSAAPAGIVTDIGSTKEGIVASIDAAQRARFVGGHPVCGAEVRGASQARADLFDGATWLLTPTHDTDPARYATLHGLISRIGARPVAIAPAAHDRLVALTSHLPHAVANLLCSQAAQGRIDGHDPLAAVGGGFRDMTRVAGANPRIWVDIFLDNRVALAAALREHRRLLDDVVAALERGDAGYLARWIGDAAAARRSTLAAAFGDQASDLHRLALHLPDRPGVISGIAQAFGAAQINIEDLALEHFSPDRGGVLEVVVAGADAAQRALQLLDEQGYAAVATPLVSDEDAP